MENIWQQNSNTLIPDLTALKHLKIFINVCISFRRVPKGCLMQKCKQIQCPSYLLGNPSNESAWLLKDQQLSLSSLAVEMTHYFPLHGCHQMPEAKANTGVSFKVYHLQGLFIRC